MPKTRTSIPKAISDQVLKEYHHKCVICGRHDPHLHHIDENPNNNAASNILPLCPNCHLQDTHNPTALLDPGKLHLFRRCKDPFVLDPRFHPIWTRLRLLRERAFSLKESRGERGIVSWTASWVDLVRFVESFKMGEYYASQLWKKAHAKCPTDEPLIQWEPDRDATDIEDICVEMLRYQGWEIPKKRNGE